MADAPLRDPAEIPRLAWYGTHSTSHIDGYLYVDARLYGLDKSLLKVRFRDRKTGAITGIYGYWIDNPDEGQRIVDEMQAAPAIVNQGPGKVLHKRLISRGNRGFPTT